MLLPSPNRPRTHSPEDFTSSTWHRDEEAEALRTTGLAMGQFCPLRSSAGTRIVNQPYVYVTADWQRRDRRRARSPSAAPKTRCAAGATATNVPVVWIPK